MTDTQDTKKSQENDYAPWRDVKIPMPPKLKAVLGRDFDTVHLSVRLIGLDLSLENPSIETVFVAGGISANRCPASENAHKTGWWSNLVGPEKLINTNCCRVIAFDYLAPKQQASDTDFYPLPPSLQADTIAYILDYLKITHLKAFLGGSYGGIVGLNFASLYPQRLQKLFCLAATHMVSQYGHAIRHVQRGILQSALNDGNQANAVALARKLGVISYRSREEFEKRFDAVKPEEGVLGYLNHQGQKFTKSHDLWRYGCLSKSIDLQSVSPSEIHTETALIAIDSDVLVPINHVQELADNMAATCHLKIISSHFGHDGFLLETQEIQSFLSPLTE